MVKLSKQNRPGLWDFDAVRKAGQLKGKSKTEIDTVMEARMAYMNSARELMADSIAVYMRDPKFAKTAGPKAAKFVRDLVNDDPRAGRRANFVTNTRARASESTIVLARQLAFTPPLPALLQLLSDRLGTRPDRCWPVDR